MIGVIDPGVRSLVQATESGRVAVIGTVGTINSGAYQAAIAAIAPTVRLEALACPGFVEFVERGEFDSEQVHVLAQRLLAPRGKPASTPSCSAARTTPTWHGPCPT